MGFFNGRKRFAGLAGVEGIVLLQKSIVLVIVVQDVHRAVVGRCVLTVDAGHWMLDTYSPIGLGKNRS